jgi:hypothetical protein
MCILTDKMYYGKIKSPTRKLQNVFIYNVRPIVAVTNTPWNCAKKFRSSKGLAISKKCHTVLTSKKQLTNEEKLLWNLQNISRFLESKRELKWKIQMVIPKELWLSTNRPLRRRKSFCLTLLPKVKTLGKISTVIASTW